MAIYLGNEKINAFSGIPVIVELDTSDATIETYDVMNGEIAYGAEGRVIGTAPFNYVETGDDSLQYRVLEDGIILSNDATSRKLISNENELKFEGESAEITDDGHGNLTIKGVTIWHIDS